MTLGRLILAWLPASVWMVASSYLLEWLRLRRTAAEERPSFAMLLFLRGTVAASLAEATVLTLIASLWFNSLGSGGWGLLFGLLGALPALPAAARRRYALGWRGWEEGLWVAGEVARYVMAGGMLAWLLD